MRNLIITPEELIRLSSSELDDEKAEIYANIATDYIENLIGVSIEEAPYKEYLEGNNQNVLYLKKRPVKDIISIKINGVPQNKNNFIVYKDKIQSKQKIFKQGFGINFPHIAMQNRKSDFIEIEYLGGFKFDSKYGRGEIPWDLKLAIANLVSQLEFENSTNSNVKSYKVLDISYTFASAEEKNNTISSILKRYFSW